MPTAQEIVAIARLFLYVREDQTRGQNHGLRVNGIQRWCGGRDGDSWCAYYATMVLDIAFEGHAPIPRHGSCEHIRRVAKAMDWLTLTPATGDLFLYVDGNDRAHHIGIVTRVDGTDVYGIAGNTSPDGRSSNGDGVYERQVYPQLFIGYPRD